MKSNMLLKVSGILMIIGGIVTIILGIIALLFTGAAAAIGAKSGLLTMASLFILVNGIVSLIAGIIGAKNAAKPQMAQKCIVWGSLTALMCIIGNIIYVIAGTGLNYTNLFIGLILPAIYLLGAFQLKGKA
ncbi:MAG: hypothetical protein FWD56_06110 [Bacteroidales bacterium]|nr:hypothetical protein [Bacteroidales bacterium]